MENSRRRPSSALSLEIAEAQYGQSLAGYWPQVGAEAGFQRRDHAPDFLFPASAFATQGFTIPTGPTTGIPIPGQTINIPAQDVKLLDRDTSSVSLNASLLLWDGGMRRGMGEQAKGGVEVAKAEIRRTDMEIQDSVTRMYYSSVLARQLHQLGLDTLARMEATLGLTETMYKEGSGKVKKTDYLENKVMVETIRAAVATLEKNEAMAQAALANTMGLNWQASVAPATGQVPYEPYAGNLDQLVSTAYRFNLDWEKLEAGIRALQGAETTARSGDYPKLAVTVDLHQYWNDYDAGLMTHQNKEGWTLGIGLKIPIFSGNLVRNQVREARARVGKAQEDQILLKEGIGLMVKDTLLSLNAARKAMGASEAAMKAAEENRDLNTRAYESELVETQDVIKAQLVESLMTAQYLKTRFDHATLQSQLTLIIGSELWKKLQPGQ
jgi:outer membrane protein TolC